MTETELIHELTVGDCITAAWLTLADRPQEATDLLVKAKGAPLTDEETSLRRSYCGLILAMGYPDWAENIAQARMADEGL